MARKFKPRPAEGPFEIRIHDLTQDAAGVAKQADGKTLFIPDTLPGEQVRYMRTRRRRDVDEGRLLEVLEPSSERVIPQCTYFGVCGGCSLQHLDATAQLQLKQRWLLDNLTRHGKVEPESLLPPLTGPLWGYRRRARLSVRHVYKKERVLVGFREREKPIVTAMEACEVLDPMFGRRLAELGELIASLSIHDQLPQIEVAVGDDGAAMVMRVLQSPSPSDRELLARYMRATGIGIWLQSGKPDQLETLQPDMPQLSYRLPNHAIEICFAPNDFVQINAEVNRRMVDQAIALLDPQPQDRLLELFSGLGNFSLPLARRVAAVVAVEGEAGLVRRAQANAAHNNIHNVEHHVADLCVTDASASWLSARYDAVLLDPPRAGAREVLPLVAANQPRRILYVSCHPGTLARDAGVLVHAHGYRLRAAGVMDMFPHTSHVESMALFERL